MEADPTSFSEAQLLQAGLAYHRGTPNPRCPFCDAPMEAQEAAYFGKASIPVDFICIPCRLHGRYEIDDAIQEWSLPQQANFARAFWQGKVARCPHDDGVVKMFKDPSLGSGIVHGRCGICGTSFAHE